MSDFHLTFAIEKASSTGRYVRGWASVVSKNGKPVEDHQGDVVYMDDLRPAAHAFVTEARVAKAMHRGGTVGDVVESVLVDDEFVKAIGATTPYRGWWIGMEINDEAIRKRVRSGELRAFSIGGKGKRKAMESQ